MRRNVVAPTIALVVAILGWWTLAILLDVGPFLFPGPQHVAIELFEQSSYLAEQAAVTLWHTLLGFFLASAAAILTAMLLAASTIMREALLPLIVSIQAIPKVAIAPLLTIWMGFGTGPKIALVILLCYFPVLIATLAGLTSTPAELVDFARSLSAKKWAMFVRIRIPWALPQIFTGLKVAISLAVIGAAVAQMVVPNSGLGMVVMRAGQAANTALAFAALAMFAFIGIGLFSALTRIERRLLPWARATTA